MATETSPSLLSVRTLGRFEIRQGDEVIAGLTLRKARALFVYLLLNPGPHDRSRLAGLLWGDCVEEKARHNLRQTLWRLRQSLPPDLLRESRLTVELVRSDRVQVDALLLEEAMQRAEHCRHRQDDGCIIKHLREAVSVYLGEFMPELEMADIPEYAAWHASYATYIREMALTALSNLTNVLLRQGDYEQALGYARRQLLLAPWWEEGHRLMITLLALTGQRSAAIVQYETCRQRLLEEVGVEPMPETTALYRRLLQWQADDWSAHIAEPDALQLPFIGRGAEHARLVAWWERARQGGRRLALVEGEAGVGKTRLVEEVIRYAEMQGALILRGRCYEFGGDIPYQPIADAMRSFLRSSSPIPLTLSPIWLAELARLTPELHDWHPDLPKSEPATGLGQRQRLFEAVTRFLRALAQSDATPLLFFLDDLHWADASTLDLLHYLLRNLNNAPVWLVGTYRPEEAGPDHLFTRLRQGLSRDRLVNYLSLARLSSDAVAEIARALVDDEAAQPLGAFLYRESEGNPFFLAETVYSLHEKGMLSATARGWREPAAFDIIPRSVQDVILQRVGRLSSPARRLLTLAAVIGRHFDGALLRVAAGEEATMVSTSLEEWLTRHLVQRQPSQPGQYDFSHDKIRATIYRAADVEWRRLLHRQVGEALEQMSGTEDDARVELLAYHWRQAGEARKAIPYLLQAGNRARMLYAHQEAVAFYEQALAMLQALGDDEESARTLMKLGITHHHAFNFDQASTAYDQAFRLWRQTPRPPYRSRIVAPQPLRIRWQEPDTLDPSLAPDTHTDCLVAHLFSGLVALESDMSITPDVARRWEVSPDGQRILFYLRSDVRWRDGVSVTAHDFEYAWKRNLDPGVASPAASFLYDLRGARAFHQRQGSREGVGVRALDDFTLLVELAHPVGYFLPLITHAIWRPVPRHVVEKLGHAWAQDANLVSNGPFFLTSWEPGRQLTLTRNPHYHGRFRGNLQQVILLSIADGETRFRRYEAGELDVLGVSFLDAQTRTALLRHRAEERRLRPQLETYFLSFDVTRPPLDDVRVRRAFALAVSRQALAEEVLQGYVAPATGGLTPPGMPGHVPGIASAYDPAAARAMLSQEAVASSLTMLAYEAVADRARFLQTAWQEVLGVDIALDVVTWPEFLTRFRDQPYHFTHLAWGADYPDPDDFLRVSRARAWPQWRHPGYDQLIQTARALTKQKTRLAHYRQAEILLADELPILPLIYEQELLLIQPWVQRYPMSGIRPAYWTETVIERE